MWHDPRLLPLLVFPVGLGLLLVGGVNALLARRSPLARLVLSALVCVGGTGPVLLWVPDETGRWAAAGALVVLALLAAALGSPWLPKLVTLTLRLLGQPRARWASLAALGLVLLAVA